MTYKQSKGERIVEEIFIKNKIKYKREFSFPELKSLKGKILRFDFAIFDNSQRIVFLVEVDGIQHFEQIKHFQKTKLDFRYIRENDRRKNSFCLKKVSPQ